MKKVVLLLFMGILALSFDVSAQTAAPIAKGDTLAMKEFVGKFKVKDAPIEDLIVTIQGGKLMGEAVGQGTAELAPTKEVDIFEVVGYDGKIEFIRNETKAIIKVKLTVQGNTMEGEKQQ